MGSEWNRWSLDELITKRNQGVNTTTEKVSYSESGITVIRANNVTAGIIDYGDVTFVDRETFSRIKDPCKPIRGDVLYTNIGSRFGNAAPVATDEPFAIAWNVLRLQPNEKIDSAFLVYLLNEQTNKSRITGLNSSSTMPFVSGKEIGKAQFTIPPLPEQTAIAHILGSLDDKIELNRKMNATLEGMAQALFKSWFVDFDPVIDNALAAGNPILEELADRAEVRRIAIANGTANREAAKAFPDSFQETEELGWIPEGWEMKSLEAIIKLIGGGTPKTSIEEYWNGDIPWFSVVDAPNNSDIFVIDTEKKVTSAGVANSSTKVLRKGTTIISARGTVGKCALVGRDMAMNQSCYGIQGADDIGDIFTYYTVREYVADLQQRGHGSVFNTITRDTFKTIAVPFCGKELTHHFDKVVSPKLDRIRSNLSQLESLTKLRDTLLPKLISGELRIPEAEQLTEEALS